MSATVILGAGVTGLAAGWASGAPIYEAAASPGGICSSYYMRPGATERAAVPPDDGEAYRFEIGGGHWIFGGDPAVMRFLRSLVPLRSYERRSGVYLSDERRTIPYPIQHHLRYLDADVAAQALTELTTPGAHDTQTMAAWLRHQFGSVLCRMFFDPFHERYTAGLWRRIAPQDPYKSPVDPALAARGAMRDVPPVGYNVTFDYPEAGLDALARALAAGSAVHYGKRVVRIDLARKQVQFADRTEVRYGTLVSTLPLYHMLAYAGLEHPAAPDPFTSVLVLNLGAERGPACPDDHWLYVPDSRSGFHRVGFYSNVEPDFLPASARGTDTHVSLYVERSYPGGQRPEAEAEAAYVEAAVQELQAWGFIGDMEVADPTWIEVAYTWSWPESMWRKEALALLEHHGIVMVGRYGRWIFQGIADSIRDGLGVGEIVRL